MPRHPDRYRILKALNVDPLMINTVNCVLHFENVETDEELPPRYVLRARPHERELMLTKMMDVEYYPTAKCDVFDRFMKSIQPDPKIRKFLQRWFGYNMTGSTTEKKLCFFYGEGRNGKSTIVDLIAEMTGPYAATVPIESLAGSEQRKGSDATPDLVRLPGARMVHASEPEKGQKLREALVKQLTGGEEILARRMMQEFVEVKPEFKLTISGNYKPEIRGTDKGIWRRVLMVPFLTTFADADVDKALPKKLWKERAGILNWLLNGCREWLHHGLIVPAEILAATEEYRTENDPIREFLDGCCEVTGLGAAEGEKPAFIHARDLNDAFNWWIVDTGAGKPWGSRTLFDHFKAKERHYVPITGHEFKHHKADNTGWKGIKLKDAFIQHREAIEAEARYAQHGDPRRRTKACRSSRRSGASISPPCRVASFVFGLAPRAAAPRLFRARSGDSPHPFS